MDIASAILTGFGLSAPAGLNAWLTLLIVGLAARFTHLIKLTAPFDTLSTTPALIALSVLLFIEIFADKIPAVDTINDVIHSFIRPVAGGILFAAHSGAVGGLDPGTSFALGLLAAGSVHAVKMGARPVVTATTAGIGNPFVSFFEDIVAAGATLLALVAPVVSALLMLIIVGAALYFILRWRIRRRRKREARI